jgi:ribose transport system ATP-binding protein/rhamnose transport system ATP-binding protein
MLLVTRGLTKSYGGVTVLAGLDLDVGAGEIRALVGENGAGKSTLIKVLTGAVVPDRGDARLDGEPLPLGRPLAIRDRGVSVVYQEFTLVPDLTVAENVFLGRERGTLWLNRAEMRTRTRRLLDALGVSLDPAMPVRGLSVAGQQMVEIARALATEARVLILDEPSATLTGTEVESLFRTLRALRARGLGVIYVSHRLDEIFRLADSVTVLRDGRHVVTAPAGGLTRDVLIRQMVGRDVTEEFPPRAPVPGETVLALEHLSAPPRFQDASMTVRAGEIVGVAGLVGAGRTSMALATVGAIRSRGVVRIAGSPAGFSSPSDAIQHRVAYVTEDRKAHGLFPLLGVDENITLTYLSHLARAGLLNRARLRARAVESVREFDIRAADLAQPAGTLSGGNQQKALVARFVLEPLRVLILDEPTRGVDVGARAEIYRAMNRLTASGLGILMISSDLPEVLGMSDRVVVMRRGRTVGELARAEATAERVMALAAAAA